MTLYLIDISNNNGPDIDLAEVAREGFAGVFAKVSEGSGFRDYTWPRYRDSARAAGLAIAGYHYLRGTDVDAQADLFLDQLGDPECPIMIDFEDGSGDIGNYWAFSRAVNARGRQVSLSYIPRWYWQNIGSPDISGVPGLIQSSFVAGGGLASELYPGDDSSYWDGFGGRGVDILQFTDNASVAGYSVDANAFRGTRADLDRLLGTAPAANPQENDMDFATFKAYMDNVASDIKDIRQQITGGRDRIDNPDGTVNAPASYPGWPQLDGKTVVDAIADIRDRLKVLEGK
jgi:hypothetical protein